MCWPGWGTPIDIPIPPGGEGDVPDWSDLKFNPLGIYNLCHHLGALQRKPGTFMKYKSHFLSSDIAWFSAGIHKDGQHVMPRDTYHPLFLTAHKYTGTGESATKLRNKLRDAVRDEVFDLVSSFMKTKVCIWWLHHGHPCRWHNASTHAGAA